MRRPAFYRRPSELPADAEAELLAVEAVDRVARLGRLADQGPRRRERVAPEEAVLPRLHPIDRRRVVVAAAREGHAEAVVPSQVIGPLHALAGGGEAGGVAPEVARAKTVAFRVQPAARKGRI